MQTNRKRNLLLVITAATIASCGGATITVKPSSEFTSEHAEFFEDGVDYIADPTSLGGDWQDSWYREAQKRVEYSDFIGVVTVRVLRTDTDPSRRTSYRLLATVDKSLLGDAPKDGLSLVSTEGQVGFDTVNSKQKHILNRKFLAFVKWYETEEGLISAHWHLSPSSDIILSQIDELLKRKDESSHRTRVVVHTN